MENITMQKQKLSLSSPLQKLQSTLWEQKKQNHILEKQNIVLNTKINSFQNVLLSINQNSGNKINSNDQKINDHKQKLQQLYAEIKQQQNWIKNTVSLIEQKKLENYQKTKAKIQKKLNKTNRKYKQTTKKINNLQKILQKEQYLLKQNPYFLAQREKNEEKAELISADVIVQLEKQHQQLKKILNFKQNQLNQENQKVKSLNSQLIELLELKNYLRKYVNRQKNNFCQLSASMQKKSNQKSVVEKNIKLNTMNPFEKIKKGSYMKCEPKLKITTY